MNKNIIISAMAAAMTLFAPSVAVAQNAAQLKATARKAGPMELMKVPENRNVEGQLLHSPAKAPKAAAASTTDIFGRTFYGLLINSTEWTDVSITNVPYGIYSLEMGAAPTFTNKIKGLSYDFLSGAYYRGKFFGISQMSVMGALNGARYITLDTENWTEAKNVMYDTSKKRYSLLPSVMTYDATDDNIYAFMYKDDLSGLDWCKYNREYDEMDKIASFRGKYNVLALAALPDGTMYFINSYGDLYRLNKENGRPTYIEWTGVTPVLYSQTMTYDNRTGMFLWAAQTANGSKLYTVNPETAETTQVISFKNAEQMTALYSTESVAKDAAPAQVENLKLTYEADGSLSGTISFDIPSLTYAGGTLANPTLNVWLDGVNLKGTEVAPGSKVSIPVTLTEGNHYVSVNLKNAEGWSPTSYIYQYAGYDVPEAVNNLVFVHSAEGMNTVTWTAPAGGVNDGFVDFDNLSYTIVRMPDSVTVADNYKGLSYEEHAPSAMHNYSYRVYAVNNGKRGAFAESNSIICGDAFTVPYSQNFTSSSTFTDFFTTVDGNEDGNTWRAGYGGDIRIDINANNAPKGDDWLITPGVDFDEAAMYRYTMNMKTFSSGYPEDFKIYIGTDPKDLTTFKEVASEENFELYKEFSDYNADFYVDAPGRYYVAVRYLSDTEKKGSMMMVKSVAVTKLGAAKAPASVSDLKITPDANDAMSAEVSFTAPATTVDGGALASITKINVFRNDAAEPIHTFDNPQPGAALSFTDNKVSKVGFNDYTVSCDNEAGTGVAVSGTAFIGVFTAPYLEPFDSKSAVNLYKSDVFGVTESNYESCLWKYSDYNQCLNVSAFNSNESDPVTVWLFTPKFKLDANSVYSFGANVNVNLYSETITNKVYMGTDATPESQTTFLADLPRSTNYKKVPVAYNVVTTDEGKFYFSIKSHSTKQWDYISADVDDVSVTYLKSAFSPYAFTDYNAEAAKNGSLRVDMQFKAPEVDYQGTRLTDNLKVEIFRGQSSVPVFSKDDVVPGAQMTWTDTQAQHGRNTYMIVAQNAYGRSEVLMDTIYVGRDLPVYVQNMEAKGSADNKDAVLTWDAPTVGVNGGVIIDSELSYNVYSYNVETKALTLIKSGIKDHTYTVVNDPLEEQDTYAYAVSAVNTEGESQAYARQVILGPLYTLPYKESFPAKETTTKPWNVITENSYALTWGVTNPDGSTYNGATAQDGDGGVAYFYNGNYYETYGGAGFVSPKLTLGNVDATLKFWVYNIKTAYPEKAPTFEVYVRADDGEYDLAAKYTVGSDTEDGWKQYEIALDKYTSSSFISLAFYGFTNGKSDVIYLDNIEIDKKSGSSIANPSAGDKQISAIRYHDISGRELKTPQSGVCIRTVTYSDGTVKSEKIIKK